VGSSGDDLQERLRRHNSNHKGNAGLFIGVSQVGLSVPTLHRFNSDISPHDGIFIPFFCPSIQEHFMLTILNGLLYIWPVLLKWSAWLIGGIHTAALMLHP
jgi:hypothetical protein